jgi:hypothetical protein
VTVLGEGEEESVQSSEAGIQPVTTTTTVDQMMESFTQELDGMEQGPDLHEMIERAKSRAEQSYNNNYNNNRSDNTGGRGASVAYQQQQYAVDPYASRSRRVEDYRETPDMRRQESSTPQNGRRIIMTTTTPQEPKPVRTPPYQRQSPLPAASNGYSTHLEGGVDPERENFNYEDSSRRPSVRAQEVPMQSPTPNGYGRPTRLEGAADIERERKSSKRAEEVNNDLHMQSLAAPNGYNSRLERDVDPERENFIYENSSRRTSVRAQEGHGHMQSPTPNGYGRPTRLEGAADLERERRPSKRAEEVNNNLQMQSPAAPNGYNSRLEAGIEPERENFIYENRSRRTSNRAEEVNLDMPSPAPNGRNTRLEGPVVDPERDNYENSSKRTSKRVVEVTDRGGDNNMNLPPLSSVTLILDSMGETMERQESRIRFLEEENEALRAEMEYHRNDQRPTSNSRSSPHPEPVCSAQRPPRSRPAPTSARSPVRQHEPWEQTSTQLPPTRSQPISSARSPMRESREQHSAPPSTSRSASKARSPMHEAWERSAPPLRDQGPEPPSFHLSREETRHSSPRTRSPRPELWDHQTAPSTMSLGSEMHDHQREVASPATYRRTEQDVGRHRTFSPGTKFVAELSNVMELDEGYHAPLSYVMDKYWDMINQVRNGHGWDR